MRKLLILSILFLLFAANLAFANNDNFAVFYSLKNNYLYNAYTASRPSLAGISNPFEYCATVLGTSAACVPLRLHVTLPQNVMLVDTDNNVINDVICESTQIKAASSPLKGEWWVQEGPTDSPPIHWVDDANAFIESVIKAHASDPTLEQDMGNGYVFNIKDGQKDDKFGVPLYKFLYQRINFSDGTRWLAYVYGSVVCSQKQNSFSVNGQNFALNNYVSVPQAGVWNLNVSSEIECFYYAYAYQSRNSRILRQPYLFPSALFPVSVMQTSSPFLVDSYSISKTLNVEKSADKPQINISSYAADNLGSIAYPMIVQVKIRNSGATQIQIASVDFNVPSNEIACDKSILDNNEEAECLFGVKPQTGKSVSFDVKYKYNNCGAAIAAYNTKQLEEEKEAVSGCSSDRDCLSGYICCDICRNPATGACEDIGGDGKLDWIFY